MRQLLAALRYFERALPQFAEPQLRALMHVVFGFHVDRLAVIPPVLD